VDLTAGPPLSQYFRRLIAAEATLATKLHAANERIAEGPYALLRNRVGAVLSTRSPLAPQRSLVFRPFRARQTELAS
jgi:hypothetical protein